VRQQQTRDNLVVVKAQADQIKEIEQTLDNLCQLLTTQEGLRESVYRLDDAVHTCANRLKQANDNENSDLLSKLCEVFWQVQQLSMQFNQLCLGLKDLQSLVSMISGVRDFSSLGLS
jgi:hypothetical protein